MMIENIIKKKYYFFNNSIKKSDRVMTIDQLLVLQAIVQSGSFKAAADVLHKTQPALSASIKKLEEEIGFSLFNRDLYRPVLTVQGEYYYQKALRVLNEVNELNDMVRCYSHKEEPEISIAIDGISPLPVILRWLKEFGESHPHTKLNLSFEVLTGTEAKVIRRESVFGITHFLNHPEKMERVPVCDVRMMPLISAELWEKEGISSEKDLQKIDQLVVGDSNPEGNVSFGLLESGRKWRVKEGQLKTHLIFAGLGWGHLPEHEIRNKIDNGELKVLEFENIKPKNLEINLIRLKDDPLGPVSSALWDFLKLRYERSKA